MSQNPAASALTTSHDPPRRLRDAAQPPSRPAAPPAPDNTRWTGAKAAAFLKALSRHGKVAPAARSVGMSRQAAYRLRARAPKFAEMWDWAMREALAKRTEARAASCPAGRRAVHPLLARASELDDGASCGGAAPRSQIPTGHPPD